jgi:hypothetical protein
MAGTSKRYGRIGTHLTSYRITRLLFQLQRLAALPNRIAVTNAATLLVLPLRHTFIAHLMKVSGNDVGTVMKAA